MSWDPGATARGSRLGAMARLVRIEHTLFSLPFAYAGAVLAGVPGLREVILIFTAVLGLRTAAMAYNNIADLDIDARNPRTSRRPLVTGAVTLPEAWSLVAAGSLLYFASAAMLNLCAVALSPLLWLVAMSYPYAKRIHCLPHLHLGFTLGLVVLGGYVAVAGDGLSSIPAVLAEAPWILVVAVTLWVAGFDTLYSLMDVEFDRKEGLGSIAACYGAPVALRLSVIMEVSAITLFMLAAIIYGLGPIYLSSVATAAFLEALQYLLHNRGRYKESFNVNLLVGVIVSAGLVADKLL